MTTLEVTDLKQWRYCPRIVWYRYCLPAIRPITDLMEHGIRRHQEEAGREERRSLRPYGLSQGERHFDLALRSERLGVRGRIDLAIAVPDRTSAGAEAVVVEYKDSESTPGAHFRLQLTVYALLLEEAWGLPVKTGWIYLIPLRRAEKVAITPAVRRKAQEAIAQVQTAINGEVMPAPPTSRRPCVSCEFRRFCNDVV
jgi:CRISPR-associated exonuclease Cas4